MSKWKKVAKPGEVSMSEEARATKLKEMLMNKGVKVEKLGDVDEQRSKTNKQEQKPKL